MCVCGKIIVIIQIIISLANRVLRCYIAHEQKNLLVQKSKAYMPIIWLLWTTDAIEILPPLLSQF